jgi:hypothetical protein
MTEAKRDEVPQLDGFAHLDSPLGEVLISHGSEPAQPAKPTEREIFAKHAADLLQRYKDARAVTP